MCAQAPNILLSGIYNSLDRHKMAFKTFMIHFNIQSENIVLEIEYAHPIGLVINELITNSLKYAFPNNQKGNTYV